MYLNAFSVETKIRISMSMNLVIFDVFFYNFVISDPREREENFFLEKFERFLLTIYNDISSPWNLELEWKFWDCGVKFW